MTKPRFFLPIHELATPKGRISRLQYFVFGLITAVIMVACSLGVTAIAEQFPGNAVVQTLTYVIFMCVFLYTLVCLYAKRLHDLGWPAAICIIALFDIPIDIAINMADLVNPVPPAVWNFNTGLGGVGNVVAMVLGLILTFRRGQRGANKHGPDPLAPAETDTSVF